MKRRLKSISAVTVLVLATAAPAGAAFSPTPHADYNNDGYDDVAAGVPREAAERGVVNVAYGSAAGLTTAGAVQLDQATAGGVREWNDRFGAALGSGDFDGDGYSDLAVGVPGEDHDAGAVDVVYGGSTGLTGVRAAELTQASAGYQPETGDGFGDALAAADYNGDGYDDVAVGAPFEDIAGKVSTSTWTDVGYVTVLYGGPGGLTGTGARTFSENTAGGTVTFDRVFGSHLTAGDFDADGHADLVVGMPYYDSVSPSYESSGRAALIYGSARGLTSSRAFEFEQAFMGGNTEDYDEFGLRLATGRFNDDPYSDLVVAAPTETTSAGQETGVVNVAYGSARGLVGTGARQINQGAAGGTTLGGVEFGLGLGAGDFDGDGRSELVIGTPSNAEHLGPGGLVNLMPGGASGPSSTGARQFNQNYASGFSEEGDQFGWAFTAGDYNGDSRGDLVVGARDEGLVRAGEAGAFNVLYGTTAGLKGTGSKQFSQSMLGGTSHSGEAFGGVVR